MLLSKIASWYSRKHFRYLILICPKYVENKWVPHITCDSLLHKERLYSLNGSGPIFREPSNPRDLYMYM